MSGSALHRMQQRRRRLGIEPKALDDQRVAALAWNYRHGGVEQDPRVARVRCVGQVPDRVQPLALDRVALRNPVR